MVYALGILELAGLNIILALSVYATLMVGQFSLAQVGFWSIGAYSVGMLTTLFGVPLACSAGSLEFCWATLACESGASTSRWRLWRSPR